MIRELITSKTFFEIDISKNCLFFLISAILFTSCINTTTESDKPNIIFLLSDDQQDNTFGAMGHPIIKTPNTDKLINEGVRFSNAYIAEPTCSPSRISLFTGMHERVTGVGFTSSYQLTEEQWEDSYPEILRVDGYYTGFIGKFGVEYYNFKGKASEKFDFWQAHDGWARFWPKNATNCFEYYDSKEDIITPIMGESISRFLDATPADKPFCLSVSFSVPHGSQIISMYPGVKEATICKIPANNFPELKGHPFYDTLYRNTNISIPEETGTNPYIHIPQCILDQSKGRATGTYIYNYDTLSCKEHHIRYYQQISGMDKVIGDMVNTLKEKGLSNNTIIIFTSDHGLLMGDYGMGGKALLYDKASKIPCFIFDPRMPIENRGQTIDNLVSSLDITSTILDYAGIIPPDNMQGKSLISLIEGETEDWRTYLFLENLYTGRDNPFCEGIRMDNWKYIRMYDGIQKYKEEDVDFTTKTPDFEQLFNLNEDPKEINNLIEAYESSEILSLFRSKTADHSIHMNKTRKLYKSNQVVEIR